MRETFIVDHFSPDIKYQINERYTLISYHHLFNKDGCYVKTFYLNINTEYKEIYITNNRPNDLSNEEMDYATMMHNLIGD